MIIRNVMSPCHCNGEIQVFACPIHRSKSPNEISYYFTCRHRVYLTD